MIKMKPCPFCGTFYKGKYIACSYEPDPFECSKCGAHGPYIDHEEYGRAKTYEAKNKIVAEAWNKRTIKP